MTKEHKLYGLFFTALFGLASFILIVIAQYIYSLLNSIDVERKFIVKELVHIEEILQDIATD